MAPQYPTDPFLAAQVDQVLGGVADFAAGLDKIHWGSLEGEAKAAALAAHAQEAVPKWTGFFEALITSNTGNTGGSGSGSGSGSGGPFIVGGGLTIADIALFDAFDQAADRYAGAVAIDAAATPQLAALVAAVGANPGIAAFIAASPASDW